MSSDEPQMQWLIPPGPTSKTGVPRPQWMDWPESELPWHARALRDLVMQGVEREYPQKMKRALDDPLLGFGDLPFFGFDLGMAWQGLRPHERKALLQYLVLAFDIDILVFPDQHIELAHPAKDRPKHEAEPRITTQTVDKAQGAGDKRLRKPAKESKENAELRKVLESVEALIAEEISADLARRHRD